MHQPRIDELRIDEDSAPMEPRDLLRLAHAESALERGLALKRWWHETTGEWEGELTEDRLERLLAAGIHPHCFRLTRRSDQWPENLGYGFFDRAPIDGEEQAVLGRVQQVFFDQPMIGTLSEALRKHSVLGTDEFERGREQALDHWRDGLRAFVSNYFLRCSSYETANAPYVESGRRPLDPYLRPFSWYSQERDAAELDRGVFHSQVYYKRRGNGRVGKFRRADRDRLALRDVERLGKYTWIVLRARLFGAAINIDPFGSGRPYLTLPFEKVKLGILSRDFIRYNDSPKLGAYRGRYSLGYALEGDPAAGMAGHSGFQTLRFLVKDDGKILVQAIFVRRRPKQILGLVPNPLAWGLELAERTTRGTPLHRPLRQAIGRLPFSRGFDPVPAFITLANASTGGLAERMLGISRDQLQKRLLIQDAIGFMDTMDQVMYVWRAVSDWTQKEKLPPWTQSGQSG